MNPINNTMNNQNNMEFSPIAMDLTPAAIRALGGKSSEEKIYLVLYNRADEDSNGFLLCEGRMDCYTSIDRLLHTYPVDIHNSAVLVEVPAVNRKGVGEWMLKGIDNAPSIYQFCKSVECFFPNSEFSIDDFNDMPVEDDSYDKVESNVPVTEEDLRSMNNQPSGDAVANAEITEAYKEMLKDKENLV